MEAQSLPPCQARWAAFLSAFNFSILHLPAKTNPADIASRCPVFLESNQNTEALILFKKVTGNQIGISSVEMDSDEIQFDITFAEPTPEISEFFQEGYKEDEDIKKFKSSNFLNSCWWIREKLNVRLICRDFILQHYHAHPVVGHWGIAKTLDLISRSFAWSNMRMDVLTMIKYCGSCQKVDRNLQPPQGSLMPLSIPGKPRLTLCVEFIVKFPKSSCFDSIMVVVDYYSKAAHFIPAR